MKRKIVHRSICLVGALLCLFVSVLALQAGIHDPNNFRNEAACSDTASQPGPMPSTAKAALETYEGLQQCLSATVNLSALAYIESPTSYATAWPMGQTIESTLAISMIPGAPSHAATLKQLSVELRGLSYYFDSNSRPTGYDSGIRAPFGMGSAKYYDDNDWIGIALAQLYQYTHDVTYLKQAQNIFALEQFGTKGTDKYPHPGGVFWTQDAGDYYRATVSTAGAVELALRLYLVTKDRVYLQFAIKEYNWVNATTQAPNCLYHDGINPDGSIAPIEWTYNQGLMLGDATLLYKATGDPAYLAKAQCIAAASLAYFGADNGSYKLFIQQPAYFDAIFFKNLAILDSVAPNPVYRADELRYATLMWSQLNAMHMLLFPTNQPKAQRSEDLLSQAAMVQIYSYLSMPVQDVNLT